MANTVTRKIYKGEKYHRDIKLNRRKLVHEDSIKNELRNHGREVIIELERLVSTGTRSGRVYMYKGLPYIASAAGEPPAARSGAMSKGFRYLTRTNELRIGNVVFSDKNAPYPLFLEIGTGKMKPRPYFIVTIEGSNMRLKNNLEKIRG